MSWLVNVDFRESPIHGTGAFAAESIKQGTKVWSIDSSMKIVGPAELGALSDRELHFALYGGYFHHPSRRFVYYDDGMQFVNHAGSDRANIGITEWTPLMEDNCTALRDIEAGEELLEDYTFWSVLELDGDHWLTDLYQDFCPEHYDFLLSLAKERRAA